MPNHIAAKKVQIVICPSNYELKFELVFDKFDGNTRKDTVQLIKLLQSSKYRNKSPQLIWILSGKRCRPEQTQSSEMVTVIRELKQYQFGPVLSPAIQNGLTKYESAVNYIPSFATFFLFLQQKRSIENFVSTFRMSFSTLSIGLGKY